MANKQKALQSDLAVAAYEALIARHGGRISPADVLDEAKDESSPLHEYFEWDDDEAAERYRLAQASSLIRRWRGSIMRVDEKTKTVVLTTARRVQSPSLERGNGSRGYVTVEAIMADPAMRSDMIRTVLKELQAYRRRYADLVALSDIWSAIDDAVDLHEEPKRKDADEAGEGVSV